MTTIQVIDDDMILLARMATLLEEAGYTVLTASELSHAEAQFSAERPAMVIIEVKSGRDAGWQYLEQIAKQTTVIVVSTHSREEDVVRGLNAGAIDYIAKPYRSQELLVRIRLRLNMVGSGKSLVATSTSTASTPTIASVPALALPGDNLPMTDALLNPDIPDQLLGVDPPVATDLTTDVPYPPHDHLNSSGAIFMAENEELALIRSHEHAPAVTVETALADLPLGQRLHRERLRRRMTLVQAESELHIRMWYLQAMEEEKFALLPNGPAATHMLRSYATHLGLNADEAVAEYMQSHYTAPVEPPPSLGSSRPPSWSVARWKIWVAAIVLALIVSGAGIVLLDPSGARVLTENLGGAIIAPTITPTPVPTSVPTVTLTATPEPTATPAPIATQTPVPPPPLPVDGTPPAEPGTLPPGEVQPTPPLPAGDATPPAEPDGL